MNQKIAHTITGLLEKDILKGAYTPGTKFPSERELAERFGASRSSVREAVQRLSQLGLLETRPQSGSYVSDFNDEASLDLLIHIMKSGEAVDPEVLLSLMEFRRLVEVPAAGEAARRAGADGLAMLDAVLRREDACGDDPAGMALCDYDLHRAIIVLCGNLVIRLVFNSFRPVYSFHTGLFFSLPGAIPVTKEQHRALCAALSCNDSAGAMTAMENALLYGERRVSEALGLHREGEGVRFTV